MRTIAYVVLLHLSASASAQSFAARIAPSGIHDRSHHRVRASLPIEPDTGSPLYHKPAAALVMVFDAAGRNILSLGAGELTGFDVHQLPSGTFHVVTLNEAGEYLGRDQLVISRP